MKIKKIFGLIFLIFVASLKGFIAENNSVYMNDFDNPASLNVVSSIEVKEVLSYNNLNSENYLYRQQIVLPKFSIFKIGFDFSGFYVQQTVRFNDYSIYISTGLKKVFNIGLSYVDKSINGGALLNFKYFALGAKIYNLDLDKQNSIIYGNYDFGCSALFPLVNNLKLKVNADYIHDPLYNDMIHSSINEIVRIGNMDVAFKQELYFDKSYLYYNFGGSLNYKGVVIYYENNLRNKFYQNRLGVKFLINQNDNNSEHSHQAKSIFLFKDKQSKQNIVFEPLFKNSKSVKYWKVDIFNRIGDIVKTIDGLGNYPDRISWNYINAFGNASYEGKYIAVFSVVTDAEKMYTSNQLIFFIDSSKSSTTIAQAK